MAIILLLPEVKGWPAEETYILMWVPNSGESLAFPTEVRAIKETSYLNLSDLSLKITPWNGKKWSSHQSTSPLYDITTLLPLTEPLASAE